MSNTNTKHIHLVELFQNCNSYLRKWKSKETKLWFAYQKAYPTYGCSISDLQGALSKRSGWRACYAECNTRAMQVTGLHATEDDATCRHVTCQPHAIHMPHATGHSINDGPLSSVDMYFLVRWPSTYHLIYSITASDWHLLFRWLRQCLFRRVPLHGIFVILWGVRSDQSVIWLRRWLEEI